MTLAEDAPKPIRQGEEVDVAKLAAYLETQFGPGEVAISQFPGGHSNLTYLVRHGDAVSAAENPLRPLSALGRRRVEHLAQAAAQRAVQPGAIYHSGILRAAETAEILARHLPSINKVAVLRGMLPEDDPATVKAQLDTVAESLMLVGHLPFMSRLTGLLLFNDPERPGAELVPASMLCCVRASADWKISWQIAP